MATNSFSCSRSFFRMRSSASLLLFASFTCSLNCFSALICCCTCFSTYSGAPVVVGAIHFSNFDLKAFAFGCLTFFPLSFYYAFFLSALMRSPSFLSNSAFSRLITLDLLTCICLSSFSPFGASGYMFAILSNSSINYWVLVERFYSSETWSTAVFFSETIWCSVSEHGSSTIDSSESDLRPRSSLENIPRETSITWATRGSVLYRPPCSSSSCFCPA